MFISMSGWRVYTGSFANLWLAALQEVTIPTIKLLLIPASRFKAVNALLDIKL